MNTAKNIFLTITIVLLVLGMWPVAILTAVVYLTLSIVEDIQNKKQLQNLTKEVENLKKKLEEEEK